MNSPKKRKIPKAQRSRKPIDHRKTYLMRQNDIKNEEINKILTGPHILEAEFVIEKLMEKSEQYLEDLSLSDFNNLPDYAVIDAHGGGDLIVALKMKMINCEKWEICTETHFYNDQTGEIKTIPFDISFDGISYQEMLTGAKVQVKRKSGFKTRWKGLITEITDNFDNHILSGFIKVQTVIHLSGHCQYVSLEHYHDFLKMLLMRNDGTLIEFLKNLDEIDQVR